VPKGHGRVIFFLFGDGEIILNKKKKRGKNCEQPINLTNKS
jgi:hypothetical protein